MIRYNCKMHGRGHCSDIEISMKVVTEWDINIYQTTDCTTSSRWVHEFDSCRDFQPIRWVWSSYIIWIQGIWIVQKIGNLCISLVFWTFYCPTKNCMWETTKMKMVKKDLFFKNPGNKTSRTLFMHESNDCNCRVSCCSQDDVRARS